MSRVLKYCLFILIFCHNLQAYGVWNKVKQFGTPAGCGYFFDADNGMIGLGQFGQFGNNFIGNQPLAVFWTSDGGVNWTQATVPLGGTGRVTRICMQDRLTGYASIYSNEYSVWKTTDGGKSWQDFTKGNFDLSTSIYATSKALTKTIWFGNSGGSSVDGGVRYSQIFNRGFTGSDGIDFVDDNNGVATLGPPGGASWFTNDGGVTWNNGGSLPESWSVYGVKGTKTFFAMSENDGANPGQTLYSSQDGGQNWNSHFIFRGLLTFTGHIAGAGNTLYVQTDRNGNQGLFRSDDLGASWVNVGGPSNSRDTRFVVTGCRGEVVYAFDNSGGVWKTTDGGNGNLMGSFKGIALSFLQDSLYLETHYCQPLTLIITLDNQGCNSLTLDAVTIAPNPYNEFSVDTNVNGIQLPASSSSFRLPVTFHSDSNITRHVLIHIKAHAGTSKLDTTIILVAKHSTAPEPYLGSLEKTKVGDTVVVPVYFRPTKDTFAIRHYSFHLSYDGDLLTPANLSFLTHGTLSAAGTVKIGIPEPNGILCTVDFKMPITQDSDLTLPVIYLRMGVTLSRNMSCPVRLDTFAISNSAPLPLCTIPVTEFIVDPQCGDSTISSFMLDRKMPSFVSAHPNPSVQSSVELKIYLPAESSITLDILDENGNYKRSGIACGHYDIGYRYLNTNTAGLGSGKYYLRLHFDNGSDLTGSIVITR